MEDMDAALNAIPQWLDLGAIAVGSGAATIVAGEFRSKRLDWLGVTIVGIAAGLGGGLLRDILIGIRPAAMQTESYLLVAVLAALAGMLLQPAVSRVGMLVQILDASALGFFCAVGTAKAIEFGLPVLPCIMVGTITAAGGGVVRDVLLGMPVGIMYAGSLYAFAAVAGAGAFTLSSLAGLDLGWGMALCAAVTFAVRMSSVWFGLSLPEQMSLRVPSRLRRGSRRREMNDADILEASGLHTPMTSPIQIVRDRLDRSDADGDRVD